MKIKTTEEFIEDAKKIHGDKFDYSLSEYKRAKTPIKIKCINNHIFEQTPNDHLNGHGCKICAGWGTMKENKEEFIRRSREIHGDKYDYTESEYTDHDSPLKIKCPHHGDFLMSPKNHLIQKRGCVKCKSERKDGWIRSNAFTKEKFMSLCMEVHGDLYDYSKAEYFNMVKKVTITCKKHGEFEQSPKTHIHQAHGCPRCKVSKGEKQISDYLDVKNIKHYYQYVFEDCINVRKLPFDFYLPDYKTCIEYDGIQHYKSIEFFGGPEHLRYIQENDKIKNEFCEKNNIKILRIKYNQDINKILNEHYEQ